MPVEELSVLGINERAVGSNRKADRNLFGLCLTQGEFRGLSNHPTINQRLATQKGNLDPIPGLRLREQTQHRRASHRPGHLLGSTAETPSLRVAIFASEVACLRHGQRQRAQWRITKWNIVYAR